MKRRCVSPPIDLTAIRHERLDPLTPRTVLIYAVVGVASGAAAIGLYWLVAAIIARVQDLAG